ncbi:hypothetical protein KHP62_07895 [Rhodobacteraceae bacterium NNCM2]|nr:hypothetical protein [Coraliihabitans acroporae]
MNNLLVTLAGLSDLWMTWAAVALLAVMGVTAYMNRVMCPYAKGDCHATVDEARQALSRRIFAGPRFFLTMVSGVAVTVVGLSLIYKNLYPGLGFFLTILGLVVMQTEPIRLQIREAQNRVVAASTMGGEALQNAVETLRGKHQWLVGIHFVILIGVVAAILAF